MKRPMSSNIVNRKKGNSFNSNKDCENKKNDIVNKELNDVYNSKISGNANNEGSDEIYDYSLKKQISEKNSLDYKKLLCLSSYYSLEKKIWFDYLKFFSPESFFFKNHIMFIFKCD